MSSRNINIGSIFRISPRAVEGQPNGNVAVSEPARESRAPSLVTGHRVPSTPAWGASGFVLEGDTEGRIWEEFRMLFPLPLSLGGTGLHYTKEMTFFHYVHRIFRVIGQAHSLLNKKTRTGAEWHLLYGAWRILLQVS